MRVFSSAVSLLLVLLPGLLRAEGLEPLAADAAAAFRAVTPDPPPRALAANSHFVVSDEKRHDLYHDSIAGLGGVFIGVGTDQNYLMAGWARPEVLVPMDFDQVVVDLHLVYRAFFLSAPGPDAFFALWAKDKQADAAAVLDAAYPEPDVRSRVAKAFRLSRNLVRAKLRHMMKTCAKQGVRTFLDDPEQYAYLVGMFRAGRVFPIRGDLTGTSAMRGIAEAARGARLPVRVLYLSNAEYYFDYGDSFRANVRAMPFDARSVVLRTAALGPEKSADGHYHYQVQPGDNFNAWLERPKTNTYRVITAARTNGRIPGFSTVTRLPRK